VDQEAGRLVDRAELVVAIQNGQRRPIRGGGVHGICSLRTAVEEMQE
jgi:hypothetical protein